LAFIYFHSAYVYLTIFQAEATLDALSEAMKTNTGNLLGLSIEAAKARCTVEEITYALEKVCMY
jgi:methylmalonyl-CoA mutase N-terminal domain/subunit